MQTDNRPTSPHLQIYKPQWTWVPSILHRITGGAITVGSLLLVYWLIALASGPESFDRAQAIFGSIIGQIILFGFTWALLYHTFAGIRHLLWDAGVGLEIPRAERGAKLVVFGSIVLTIVVWVIAYAI
jgi:succinate dehydrogenase / fumarate reductase cytochrome b subunit